MINLGTIRPGRTIRIPFSTFKGSDGSSLTMTNFAAADILIYKDGSTTERASTSGFTATTDFDTKTGKHVATIDLSDNTTSGFFTSGSEYLVAIDAVTVDAVTTGGWIARFSIGYPTATLDTTIATLTTQTSFTLTVGPAEDNALTGSWAIIHDIASAVQHSRVLISGYTGSTKTVTLATGATFTVAAGDNISVMDLAPLQPATLGRTLSVQTTGFADSNVVSWSGTLLPTPSIPGVPLVDTKYILGTQSSGLGGFVGIDWSNIAQKSSPVNLNNTAISGVIGNINCGITGNINGNIFGYVNISGIQNTVASGLANTILSQSVKCTEQTAPSGSLTEVILQSLNSSVSSSTMTISRSDNSTFGTRTLTLTAGANPIRGIQ